MDTGGRPLWVLDQVAERYPVVAARRVAVDRRAPTRSTSSTCASSRRWPSASRARWISDHLCWTGVAGPQHARPAAAAVRRGDAAARRSRACGRCRTSSSGRWCSRTRARTSRSRRSTMSEWEFLSRLADEADCGAAARREQRLRQRPQPRLRGRGTTSTRSPPTASCSSTWPATRTTARTSSTRTAGRRSTRCGRSTRGRRPRTGPRVDALRVGRGDPLPRRGRSPRPRRPPLSGALGGRPRERMAPELALGGLQRWLQSVIVHPGGIAEALASSRGRGDRPE